MGQQMVPDRVAQHALAQAFRCDRRVARFRGPRRSRPSVSPSSAATGSGPDAGSTMSRSALPPSLSVRTGPAVDVADQMSAGRGLPSRIGKIFRVANPRSSRRFSASAVLERGTCAASDKAITVVSGYSMRAASTARRLGDKFSTGSGVWFSGMRTSPSSSGVRGQIGGRTSGDGVRRGSWIAVVRPRPATLDWFGLVQAFRPGHGGSGRSTAGACA
jgi:hypothetical protein